MRSQSRSYIRLRDKCVWFEENLYRLPSILIVAYIVVCLYSVILQMELSNLAAILHDAILRVPVSLH
jgi:hypothetical protein